MIELTPTTERGYALSVRGLARELACALDVPFGDPAALDLPAGEGDAWPVEIQDPAGCSRFVLRRVTGLDASAPTPWWMRRRLLLAGIRSISLAVDVTNYLDALPVAAHKESLFEQLRRLAARHRTALVLVLAYLLMRVALLIFARG